MLRFSDFPTWVSRAALPALVLGTCAGVAWLVRADDHAVNEHATETHADAAPSHAPATTETELDTRSDAPQPTLDDLSALGQQLWDEYVPAEIRRQYEFPSMEEIRRFLVRLESDLQSDSAADLATYERDARRALKLLRRYKGGDLLAAWLEPRLDLIKAAAQMRDPADPERDPEDADAADRREDSPADPAEAARNVARPQYTRTYWDRVLQRRKPPRAAERFVPRLKEIFAAAGVPPELVWIAEVESAMNPEAVSPVGARGLFQFMPLTAARFGLETGDRVDERIDPEKSALAAATYLRFLHRRFRSWPLALAAYNAGEGRVGRALAAEKVSTFDDVAHRLPIETRMYVPKVLATVAARESINPVDLPPPVPMDTARPMPVRSEPTGAPTPASSPVGDALSTTAAAPTL